MEAPSQPDLVVAIDARRLVHFRYHGVQRLVIPLVYGVGRADEELLRAWQLSGPPRAGSRRGWKLYRVAAMSEVALAQGTFTTVEIPSDYNPEDPLMPRIHSRVDLRHAPAPRPQPLRNSLRRRS